MNQIARNRYTQKSKKGKAKKQAQRKHFRDYCKERKTIIRKAVRSAFNGEHGYMQVCYMWKEEKRYISVVYHVDGPVTECKTDTIIYLK